MKTRFVSSTTITSVSRSIQRDVPVNPVCPTLRDEKKRPLDDPSRAEQVRYASIEKPRVGFEAQENLRGNCSDRGRGSERSGMARGASERPLLGAPFYGTAD